MPLTLIEGHFEVIGAAPDGDSVRFYPAKKEDWKLVQGSRPVQSNKRGGAQLRLDGIDALETHYSASGGGLGITHQPLDSGRAAASALLKLLGFQNIERDGNEKVTAAQPEKVPGYILTRFADTYGRCVAFAFKGNHQRKTGASIFLDDQEVKASVNYKLLADGHAYPTYYSKLYVDLRRAMTKAVNTAQQAKKGIWAKDKTLTGFDVPGTLGRFQEEAYVLPKLYRRLLDYFALSGGDTSVDGFKAYLGERDDRIFVLSEGQITGFDTVVETNGQTVRLTKEPEDLVFQEK